jgi:hypothetical protein
MDRNLVAIGSLLLQLRRRQGGLSVRWRAEGERHATEFLTARQIKTDGSFLPLKVETVFSDLKNEGPLNFPKSIGDCIRCQDRSIDTCSLA